MKPDLLELHEKILFFVAPILTGTKQYISAAGLLAGLSAPQTDRQPVFGERRSRCISLVEWILPLSLENRALQKQTAVRARRSPSERRGKTTHAFAWSVQ